MNAIAGAGTITASFGRGPRNVFGQKIRDQTNLASEASFDSVLADIMPLKTGPAFCMKPNVNTFRLV